MQSNLKKINVRILNKRQRETYNFQKVSSLLADYGYATIRLNDDWEGADFIAQHIDGMHYLKVQLKSRLTFAKKYQKKEIYITFPYKGKWYLFDHDKMLKIFLKKYDKRMAISNSWKNKGEYSWPYLSKEILKLLEFHEL